MSDTENLGETNRNPAEYERLIAATPDPYRDWIRRMVRAIGGLDPKAEERQSLEWFADLARRHTEDGSGGILFTAMILLDSQDYEKRPWEDHSDVLFSALEYSPYDISSLLAEVLAKRTAAQSKAAKWLPKYVEDTVAVSLLTPLLDCMEDASGCWAAVHLSRLAPDTPELASALVRVLTGNQRFHAARLYWDFGLTGRGEAAEALGHLGSRARSAIPDLLSAMCDAGRSGCLYDGKLAARAVARITGEPEALSLLAPPAAGLPWMAPVLDEIKQAAEGLPLKRSPDDPAHACFFARFLWRPGEDDYCRFRTRDARGAY